VKEPRWKGITGLKKVIRGKERGFHLLELNDHGPIVVRPSPYRHESVCMYLPKIPADDDDDDAGRTLLVMTMIPLTTPGTDDERRVHVAAAPTAENHHDQLRWHRPRQSSNNRQHVAAHQSTGTILLLLHTGTTNHTLRRTNLRSVGWSIGGVRRARGRRHEKQQTPYPWPFWF
jgi:hypothetical protein